MQTEADSYDCQKLAKAMARRANALFKLNKLDESIAQYREALDEHNDANINEAMEKVKKEKDKLEAQQ